MLETKKQIRGPPSLKLHAIDIVSEVSIPLNIRKTTPNKKTQNPIGIRKKPSENWSFWTPPKKDMLNKTPSAKGRYFLDV